MDDYSKIQEQKRKGFKKSQVARKLGINRETVSVYWDMTPAEYAAQLCDWIKERTCLKTLDYQERCFRDYVKSIREEYDIKKPETSRQYEAMDELPPGRQSQSMSNLKKQYSYILDLREALRK